MIALIGYLAIALETNRKLSGNIQGNRHFHI